MNLGVNFSRNLNILLALYGVYLLIKVSNPLLGAFCVAYGALRAIYCQVKITKQRESNDVLEN